MDVFGISFPICLSSRLKYIVRTCIRVKVSYAKSELQVHFLFFEDWQGVCIVKEYGGEFTLMSGIVAFKIVIANVCTKPQSVPTESILICPFLS